MMNLFYLNIFENNAMKIKNNFYLSASFLLFVSYYIFFILWNQSSVIILSFIWKSDMNNIDMVLQTNIGMIKQSRWRHPELAMGLK